MILKNALQLCLDRMYASINFKPLNSVPLIVTVFFLLSGEIKTRIITREEDICLRNKTLLNTFRFSSFSDLKQVILLGFFHHFRKQYDSDFIFIFMCFLLTYKGINVSSIFIYIVFQIISKQLTNCQNLVCAATNDLIFSDFSKYLSKESADTVYRVIFTRANFALLANLQTASPCINAQS